MAAEWTRDTISEETRDFLLALSPEGGSEGYGLFHASPRDPVWEYVLSDEAAAGSLAAAKERLVLVGHSHVALAFSRRDGRIAGDVVPDRTEIDIAAAERWLLNPGSVGQPRDGDPRAAYLVLDLEAGLASFKRVPYAIERTQAELRDRGLPEALAERLEHGL